MKKTLSIFLFLLMVYALSSGDTGSYQVITDRLKGDLEDGSLARRNIQQLPEELLPEGISTLCILAYRLPEEGQDAIYLVGESRDGVLYDFGKVEFNGVMNIAKTDVLYRDDGYVYIFSQQPFSAFYYGAKYNWDPDELELRVVDEWTGDPSQEKVERVEELLKEGEIKEAGELLYTIFYPGNYYSDYEMAVKFLRSAHKSADGLSNPTDSCRLMDSSLDVFGLTVGSDWVFQFDSREEYEESYFGKYMDYEEFEEIMRSYGGYLEDAGENRRAKDVYDYLDNL